MFVAGSMKQSKTRFILKKQVNRGGNSGNFSKSKYSHKKRWICVTRLLFDNFISGKKYVINLIYKNGEAENRGE